MALKRYGFCKGEGLYTDMNAIRRDEDTDNLHSIYVDQWDWEKIIGKEERTIDTLKTVVNQIYEVLKRTEMYVASFYPQIKPCCRSILPLSLPQSWRTATAPHHKRTGAPDREGARRGVPDGNRRGVEKRKAS